VNVARPSAKNASRPGRGNERIDGTHLGALEEVSKLKVLVAFPRLRRLSFDPQSLAVCELART
jgi:hypothetical protein